MVAACPFPVNYGSPGAIRELAETLSEMGHDIHIVTYPEGDDLPVGNARLHRAGRVQEKSGPRVGSDARKLWIDVLLVIKLCQVIWHEKIEFFTLTITRAAWRESLANSVLGNLWSTMPSI